MAKSKYSYFKLNYGRRAFRVAITRILRVDLLGKITYVEKRIPKNTLSPIAWKVGNVSSLNVVQKHMQASTKAEYDKFLKEALKEIL